MTVILHCCMIGSLANNFVADVVISSVEHHGWLPTEVVQLEQLSCWCQLFTSGFPPLSAISSIYNCTPHSRQLSPAPLQRGGGKISTSKEISRCRGGRACPSVDLVGFAPPRIVSMSDVMHTCWAEAYLIFFNFNKQQIF